MNNWHYKLVVVSAFAIAMGFLEAVVVVYLREIYFPDGFDFPLALLDRWMFKVELVREITTIIMLVAIGLLAGRTKNGKFAWFLFTFGIWDIAYYVGLKVFLDWPSSLLTWDILFLIPVTWIGPVLAPIICALTMMVIGGVVSLYEHQGKTVRFGRISWLLLIIGSLLIFVSYIQDYMQILYQEDHLGEIIFFNWDRLIAAATKLNPVHFNWWLFAFGELLIIFAFIRIKRMNTGQLPSV